jgi:hypothetical protein
MLLALLDVAEVQLNCLVASNAAGQQHGQKRAITLFL